MTTCSTCCRWSFSLFYLYLIINLYSRDIVGWEIWPEESAEHASELITRTCLAQKRLTTIYSIYESREDALQGVNAISELTTFSDGSSDKFSLNFGPGEEIRDSYTYFIRETKAPHGFLVCDGRDGADGGIHEVTVTREDIEKGDTITITCWEKPISDSFALLLYKASATNAQKPLQSAIFALKYWDNMTGATSGEADRTWLFKTDENGQFLINDATYLEKECDFAALKENGQVVAENYADQVVKSDPYYKDVVTEAIIYKTPDMSVIHAENLSIQATNTPDEEWGYLQIQKKTDDLELIKDNGVFTLRDAVYGVYRSREDAMTDTNAIQYLPTNEDGTTDVMQVAANGDGTTYYIKEVTAPAGFMLCDGFDGAEDGIHEVIVYPGQEVEPVVCECSDKAITVDFRLHLQKADAESRETTPQGNSADGNPATRTMPNGKGYDRNKLRREDRRSRIGDDSAPCEL